jgi:hypothetical protein
MFRTWRLVVLVTGVTSLLGAMSSPTRAVTWHNTGDTAFTATAGAPTLSATGVSLACASQTITGIATGGTFVGATWSGLTATGTSQGCFWGGISTQQTCSYRLTAATQTGTGTITTGNMDVTCDITQFGTKICHVENHNPSLHAQYTNPSGGVGGRLTVTAGSLRVTHPATGSCPFGNGDTASLTHQAFVITNPAGGGPNITRTA